MLTQLNHIGAEDLEPLGEKFGRSFKEDPICEYIFPDPEIRARRARYFYEFVLRAAFRLGEVYSPGKELEGAAAWLPPEHVHIGVWQYIRAGALSTIWNVGPAAFARIDFIGNALEKKHRLHAPGPHYYLSCLGVAPEHKRKGFAGKLMAPMLARCDEERRDCYLETHNPVNPGLYERFGFQVVDESPVPKTDIIQWSMLRRPK